MLHSGSYHLCLLITWILWNGSLAEDHQFVCLLDDPNPNDADSCNTALLTKFDNLVDQQAKTQAQLTKLEGRLTAVETNLKNHLLAVQTRLENQFQAALTKVENHLQTLVNKTSSQQASNVDIPEPENKKPPSSFELIGSRHFRFVESAQIKTIASETCRQMGGYLAYIKNEQELNAISARLTKNKIYWLEHNHGSNKTFVSEPFLKLHPLYKNYNNIIETLISTSCANLHNGYMFLTSCEEEHYFICQADKPYAKKTLI